MRQRSPSSSPRLTAEDRPGGGQVPEGVSHALEDDGSFGAFRGPEDVFQLGGVLPGEDACFLSLDQVPRLLSRALQSVYYDRRACHQPHRELGRPGLEGSHRRDEGAFRHALRQHRFPACRGRDHEARLTKRLPGFLDHPRLQPKTLRVLDQRPGALLGAGVDEDSRRAEALVEGFEVGTALGTGAHDQERPVGSGASSRAASSESAAVRRAVTTLPSRIPSRLPVAASITTTSPCMVGRSLRAFSGWTVTSLVMAMSSPEAGMTRRTPPSARGSDIRLGACTAPDPRSSTTSLMDSARSAYGRRAAVSSAPRISTASLARRPSGGPGRRGRWDEGWIPRWTGQRGSRLPRCRTCSRALRTRRR